MMEMRKPGNYTLEELTSDLDGSVAFQYRDDSVIRAMAGSWEGSDADLDPGIRWSVDLDDDDLEISITPEGLANLVGRARTCCEACPGCNRA